MTQRAYSQGANHVLKAVSNRNSLPDWVRDLNYIATVVPITNRICAPRGNILFILRRLTHAWLQHAFLKCACIHESLSERAVHSQRVKSGFLGGSRSKTPSFFCVSKTLIWKSIAFTKGKSGFKSGKGQNHVPKRFSECDSLYQTVWAGTVLLIPHLMRQDHQCQAASWTAELSIQWNLIITRSLGPWKLLCYIRFLIISG